MHANLSPMQIEEMPEWIAPIRAEYIVSRMTAGESPAEAKSAADTSLAQIFPNGRHRENHLVFNVVADDDAVGYLWIRPQANDRAGKWWVWDVEIYKPFQRRGYGRDAMLLAGHAAR